MIAIIILVGLLAVILVLALSAAGIYNSLVSLRNRFKNAYAQIDVQLKRRYDLIPNLVETAKGYLKHEHSTLEDVIKARNIAYAASQTAAANPADSSAVKGLVSAESGLTGALSRLMVVSEQYPDLKANGEAIHHTILLQKAPEGVFIGQQILLRRKSSCRNRKYNISGKIPEGTIVRRSRAPTRRQRKTAKSSGAYATVVGHTPQGTMVRLPSGSTRYVNDYCLATIGVIAAPGRTDKPFLKAGEKFHLMKAKGHKIKKQRTKNGSSCTPIRQQQTKLTQMHNNFAWRTPRTESRLNRCKGPGQKRNGLYV